MNFVLSGLLTLNVVIKFFIRIHYFEIMNFDSHENVHHLGRNVKENDGLFSLLEVRDHGLETLRCSKVCI